MPGRHSFDSTIVYELPIGLDAGIIAAEFLGELLMWHAGYVSEIEYTHGYYQELAPHRLRLAALVAGQKTSVGDAPVCLELGFGQGHSSNINAASNPGTVWATDFNAAQAANAQEFATASGADIQLLDASFAELAARQDLPDFDIIALHGIWSWISDENRAIIVDLARRNLKPGGLFYISYNVTPGWSPAMPLRHIMKEHSKRASTGSMPHKIDQALTFMQAMVDAGAGYFKANPAMVERLQKLKSQDRNYLAHEYMNDNWDVMPFSQVAESLAEAKLGFACSAHLPDLVDEINLPAEARTMLTGIDDVVLRQTVRDYFVNQQFRRDIFIKGARPLPIFEQARMLREQPFMLLVQPEDCPKKVLGALGEASLTAEIYDPVKAELAANDYCPKTIAELGQTEGCKSLTLAQLIQCMTILCGTGVVAPAHNDAVFKKVTKTARSLNREFCRRAEYSSDVNYLAAPLIGAGVGANRFEQLFVRALLQQQTDPANWVWSLLKAQGQKIVLDGKAIESDEDNLGELRKRFAAFETKRAPIFRRLGIL